MRYGPSAAAMEGCRGENGEIAGSVPSTMAAAAPTAQGSVVFTRATRSTGLAAALTALLLEALDLPSPGGSSMNAWSVANPLRRRSRRSHRGQRTGLGDPGGKATSR